MSRYHHLATGRDPVLREMAEQLAQGTVRPSQMLGVPAYRAAIDSGLARLRTVVAQAGHPARPVADEDGRSAEQPGAPRISDE